MSEFWKLQRAVKVYVVLVVLVGGGTLAHSIYRLNIEPVGPQWIFLAGLTILTGAFSVKVPTLNAYLSAAEAFVFASVLLFGANAGTVTVVLECLVASLSLPPKGRQVHRLLFNMAAQSGAIWVSGTAFYSFSGIQPYSIVASPLSKLFLPFLAFTALYFLLNTWLVAFVVGLEDRKSPIRIWWNNFAWVSVTYFSGASLAALMVTYARDIELSTVAVIVPLVLVLSLTFRTAMGRIEDSYNHLAAVNRLYFSTIETLAMAIDAKDQITHGHIRRVQGYAVGLARRMGVSDEKLLSAIEAAALLHDMGKLAVPEYILNKPGKLTPAEFDKMKLHAGVGADILSAIDFPYPVVPIVRHHHENWNGTGYPTGIKGTDIPIGARILSVVDCFDALTSDRPYRPKLSDEDAIKILLERRGTMYDPLVVDTFLNVYKQIAPEQPTLTPPKSALIEITNSASSQPSDRPLATRDQAGPNAMLPLYEICSRLPGRIGVTDLSEMIAKHLRSVVPFALFVLFSYDEATDELVAQHSVGEGSAETVGLRFSLGARLSGWVAANRRTIVNSDPALDLFDLASTQQAPLRNCISTPVCFHDSLIGVMTLYSASPEGYTNGDREVVEALAGNAAPAFRAALQFDRTSEVDQLTGLYTSTRLQRLLEDMNANLRQPFALVTIRIVNLEKTTAVRGKSTAEKIILRVAREVQSAMRTTDLLFRSSESTFQALLVGSDLLSAEAVANRVRQNLDDDLQFFNGVSPVAIEVSVSTSGWPDCVDTPDLVIVEQRKSHRTATS
jgi:putative nucleotidyltransferase with HDIG domain